MKYFVTEKISDNIRKTPEGFLVCIGVPIARTGIQEYGPGETPIEVEDGETAMIQRDEKEVFRPETIASFEGKPFTIGHPDGMVTPETWSQLAKGSINNVRRGEGEFNTSLIADIIVTAEDAIKEIERGVREVSCGYEADYIQTGSGTGKQTNIIGNHLALVPEGRAGDAYAIKDHKGVKTMSVKDKIAKIFQKAQDEALKVATKDEGMEVISDESPAWAKDLAKAVGDLNKTVSSMSQPTKQGDEDPEKKKDEPAKDADPIMDAIKALQADVAALKGAKDAEEETDDSEEGTDDAEEMGDEGEEETDDEGSEMVGDEKSRIEILAPGKKFTGKDAKAKAVKVAFESKDGKSVILALNGNKEPNFKKQAVIDHLFVAASEVLKVKRSHSLAKTKAGVKDGQMEGSNEPLSIDEINKKNEEHYKAQRSH